MEESEIVKEEEKGRRLEVSQDLSRKRSKRRVGVESVRVPKFMVW